MSLTAQLIRHNIDANKIIWGPVYDLDYSPTYIHQQHHYATYVNRTCEGKCGRTLRFTPLAGERREQWCSVCKCKTRWRVGV